jgi:hypothetical protein
MQTEFHTELIDNKSVTSLLEPATWLKTTTAVGMGQLASPSCFLLLILTSDPTQYASKMQPIVSVEFEAPISCSSETVLSLSRQKKTSGKCDRFLQGQEADLLRSRRRHAARENLHDVNSFLASQVLCRVFEEFILGLPLVNGFYYNLERTN